MLEVSHLSTYFHTRSGVVHAVEDVSFSVERGETLGIVGESGSGKSVTCFSLMGLIPKPPGKIHSGTAILDSKTDLLSASESDLRNIRGKKVSMIFQDPMTSLNPYLKISTQLMEPVLLHEKVSKAEALQRAITALAEVGIPDPEKRVHAFPHEFSGGMRQRVVIAMALITKPDLLICDEPTTALDVTVQKQVLDLIKQRQQELGTAVILISHDLAVVSQVCDRIMVMYSGRVVENAPTKQLIQHPKHAYTRALIKSSPSEHAKGERLFTIPGLPPSLIDPPPGCAFRHRNTLGNPNLCLCDRNPELKEIELGHWVQDCTGCLAPQG
ncbi:ABC transporter ATP-binding protein [Rubritalea marina]|uniref:ABC transporter ATP-binding protein n=1 Tax=Rubritalea marina TaxID=361055 RepID=UPI0003670CA7|nr:ABC transporter ATP-binding protein [Rubritalea marina]